VKGERSEHHPKIKNNRREFYDFIEDSLFEVAFALMQRSLTGGTASR
jgi:hypothetical protein